jgi:predicted amidohydrolase YtcJ
VPHLLITRRAEHGSHVRHAASRSIIHPTHALLFRAVCAAEELPVRLRAVADHLAAAVDASRRERVDGAFKRVEPVRLSGDGDLHRFVVVVSAGFALRHIEQRGCGPVRKRGEGGLI